MDKHEYKIHAGGIFGAILLVSIAVDLIARFWFKLNIFKIGLLCTNKVVLWTSICIGVVLFVLGCIIGYFSHEAFNRAVEKDEKVKYIIKEGTFRLVRHPFYLSLILIALSFVLLLDSYVLLAGLIVLTPILAVEAYREEEILVKEFGDIYLDYRRKTGMFFPKTFRM
jgi:protein-S-isoprenylcysteine O-methyltransferase Ste14